MLAKDIIKSARYILSDTAVNRWTDERLLSLINDGLADIAKTTILFTTTLFAGISDNVVDYDLSDRIVKIHRVEYLDKPLPMYSFKQMDKICPGWQLEKGDKPKAIIYDLQNPGQYKIYPIVANAENSYLVFSQVYGMITFISYSDIEFLVADTFGALGSLANTGYLKIFYTRKHPKVVDTNATIELHDFTLEPLAHYVAGRALRDNADVHNRTVGNEELQFYTLALEDYAEEKQKNFVTTVHETEYRSS